MWLRDDAPPADGPDGFDPLRAPEIPELEETWLVCVQCAHRITRPSDLREVQGSSTHTFTNPYGLIFTLKCYREAQGAGAHGAAHAADSWFYGYRWRIALCGRCNAHLGWRFASSEWVFWGLIVDQLRPE